MPARAGEINSAIYQRAKVPLSYAARGVTAGRLGRRVAVIRAHWPRAAMPPGFNSGRHFSSDAADAIT